MVERYNFRFVPHQWLYMCVYIYIHIYIYTYIYIYTHTNALAGVETEFQLCYVVGFVRGDACAILLAFFSYLHSTNELLDFLFRFPLHTLLTTYLVLPFYEWCSLSPF